MTGYSVASAQENRGSIFVEDGELLNVDRWPDDQFVLRIRAPRTASRATAGSFIHIQCDAHIPMRRPLSIMRANADDGWIDILFKTVGEGLAALAQAEAGDSLSLIGPIGNGFVADAERTNAILIGGGVGIPPMIYLAEQMNAGLDAWNTLVLMGSEIPFPFRLADSAISANWLDADCRRTLAELESQGICARLASLAGFDGTFNGYVTDLARRYLDSLNSADLQQTAIYSCGPTPMLQAVASLAAEYGLPCQVSLEEFMACAVGGCAGCAVPVSENGKTVMRRVCVDGPVFDSAEVFFA